MSDKTHECACGGCGTATPCSQTHTSIKAGDLGGVYAYMGPEVNPDQTPWYPLHPHTLDHYPDLETTMRSTLQEELIKDLLERVRKTEDQLAELREEQQELRAAIDAIRDFQESADEDVPEFLKPLLRFLRS